MTHTITKHLAALAAVLLPATGMADDFYADGLYYDITGETTVEVVEVPYLSGHRQATSSFPLLSNTTTRPTA